MYLKTSTERGRTRKKKGWKKKKTGAETVCDNDGRHSDLKEDQDKKKKRTQKTEGQLDFFHTLMALLPRHVTSVVGGRLGPAKDGSGLMAHETPK